jgi:ubiquinone/menaquinone biosynthesis C-methylase UbiE
LARTSRSVRPAQTPISDRYQIIEGDVSPSLRDGWRRSSVAERQHAAFEPILRRMHRGEARQDFVALTEAVRATELFDPVIVEVGCGSGWNSEVLSALLGRPFRYVGMDYSMTMAAAGKRQYPETEFVVGDAAALPLGNGVCDIVLSGTVLMHVADYAQAIRESRRATRQWCVFHTVPVLQNRHTTMLSKLAYGEPVVEVVFNESDLLSVFRANGLAVRRVFENIPYDLTSVLGERTETRTYLCEVSDE